MEYFRVFVLFILVTDIVLLVLSRLPGQSISPARTGILLVSSLLCAAALLASLVPGHPEALLWFLSGAAMAGPVSRWSRLFPVPAPESGLPVPCIEILPQAILKIDATDRIVLANSQAVILLGLPDSLPVPAADHIPEYELVKSQPQSEILKTPDNFREILRFVQLGPDRQLNRKAGFWLFVEDIRDVSSWVRASGELPTLQEASSVSLSTRDTWDRLRMDMWRMFARETPESRSAILKILNLLGPGIGLSRINFYEIQPDMSMICQAEWCAPNQKTSVGLVLPAFLVKPFLSDDFFICTPQTILDALPPLVRPLGKPVIWGIWHTYNLERIVACPIRVEDRFEGALILCIGKDYPDTSRLSELDEDLKSLLEDARQLIGHTVYRLRVENGRKLAQDALRESETKYRNIFESLHDVYYRTDLSGRITLISPSCSRIFDFRPEEMTGRSLLQDMASQREKRVEFLERLEADGRVVEFELQMRTKSGSEIWVSTNANYYVDENNNVMGVEGILRDITERKNLEDQLIRAERMAAVGTLAGGVAHEFNNINLAILGFAELGSMRPNMDDETQHYFRVIRKSALRAKNITSNLLTFSGNTMGKVSNANVIPVLEDTLQLLKHEFSTQGIVLDKDLQPVPEAFMDASQIGQVFLNILINAQHALIDRPEKKILIRTATEKSFVTISFTDTGCGIPPDHIKKIFSPFFTTKGEHAEGNEPQAKVRGTGLGLSVSHSIVQNHKGLIEVNSRVGEGTTFVVKLPVSRTLRKAESAPARRVIESLVQLKILILDDEEDLRSLLSSYLNKQGHITRDTDDGAKALELLGSERFDLALVDLQMPAMSGKDFMERIKTLPPRNQPRLIVISGQEANLPENLVPPSCILQKPFRLGEVSVAINRVFYPTDPES